MVVDSETPKKGKVKELTEEQRALQISDKHTKDANTCIGKLADNILKLAKINWNARIEFLETFKESGPEYYLAWLKRCRISSTLESEHLTIARSKFLYVKDNLEHLPHERRKLVVLARIDNHDDFTPTLAEGFIKETLKYITGETTPDGDIPTTAEVEKWVNENIFKKEKKVPSDQLEITKRLFSANTGTTEALAIYNGLTEEQKAEVKAIADKARFMYGTGFDKIIEQFKVNVLEAVAKEREPKPEPPPPSNGVPDDVTGSDVTHPAGSPLNQEPPSPTQPKPLHVVFDVEEEPEDTDPPTPEQIEEAEHLAAQDDGVEVDVQLELERFKRAMLTIEIRKLMKKSGIDDALVTIARKSVA